jgi:hypothetical protein
MPVAAACGYIADSAGPRGTTEIQKEIIARGLGL